MVFFFFIFLRGRERKSNFDTLGFLSWCQSDIFDQLENNYSKKKKAEVYLQL